MSMYTEPPIHQAPGKSTSWVAILIIVLVVVLVMAIACAGVLAALLLPAVQAARESARRMSCQNNLHQIGLGLHNYEMAYRCLPPAFTVDAQGKPLHSWRTLILPFMEQQALYSQIDLNKPWDDPANAFLVNTIIPAYACPSSSLGSKTTYVAVVDPTGIFTGSQTVRFADISDGTSNTLMVYEAPPNMAVHWAEPKDIDLQAYLSIPTSGVKAHTRGTQMLLSDASVKFVIETAETPEFKKAVVSRRGDEVIDFGQY